MWCVWEETGACLEQSAALFESSGHSADVSPTPFELWVMFEVSSHPWHCMININPLHSAHTNLPSLTHTHTHPHISHSLKSVLRGGGWFLGQLLNQSDLLRLEWSMKATDWSRPVYLPRLRSQDESVFFCTLTWWMAISVKPPDLWPPTRRMSSCRLTRPRLGPSSAVFRTKILAQQGSDPIMNTNVDIIICWMPYSVCARQQGE